MTRSGVGRVFLFVLDLIVVVSAALLAGAAYYASRGMVSTVPEWLPFLGRLHPVVLHAPLGALVIIALVEIFRAFRGKDALDTLCMFFVLVSAFLAAGAGLVLSLEGGYAEQHLTVHMWLAVIAYAAIALTFLLRLRVDPETLSGPGAYRLALLLSAGLIGAAGHFGGTLTHGSHYLTEHADAALIALGLPPRFAESTAEEPAQHAQDSAYQTHIAPIFDTYCSACHSGDKFKGGLRLDAIESVLHGGDSGAAVMPGNAAESLLIHRVTLPLDDADHMPPEGKPQPDEAQIEQLRRWIDSGAGEDIPANLLPALPEEVTPAPETTETPEPEPVSEPAPAPETASARETLGEALTVYQAEFPGALNWVAEDSDQLSFTAVSFRTEFDDAALAKLEPFAPHLRAVDLSGTQITETGLAALLPKLTAIERLNLSGTKLDTKVLAHLAPEAPLAVLNLFESTADDGTVVVLASRKGLERLYVGNTAVTPAAIAGLNHLVPDCEVVGTLTESMPQVAIEPIVAETPPDVVPEVAEATPEQAPAESTPEASAYEGRIAPIFAQYCVGCHGAEKQKGGLRLDSHEAILAGGDSGGTVLPGDAEGSLLIERITLPIDDFDHMPPENAPQPEESDIEQIRRWIDAGASATLPLEVPTAKAE